MSARFQCMDPVSEPAYVDAVMADYAGQSAIELCECRRVDSMWTPGSDAVVGGVGSVGGYPPLPAGDLLGAADDILWHKTGRHVAHAGYWRDAVRSTDTQVVQAWGVNVVLLVVIWSPPGASIP